jgi:hypothetical protein
MTNEEIRQKTKILADYFAALKQHELFKDGFLKPLEQYADTLEKRLVEATEPYQIYRAQGSLKTLDEVMYLLGRHEYKYAQQIKKDSQYGK